MTFSTGHILLAAALVAVLTGAAAWWRLPRRAWTDVSLAVYADPRPPADPARYRQVQALAFLIALTVDVVTI